MPGAAEDDSEKRSIRAEDFDSVVCEHQKQIYRTVLFIVRDADTAETLTQECFLRAYQKRDSYRGEASVSTWLVRIAINLAHDHMRSRRLLFWRRLTRTERIERFERPDARRSAEKSLIDGEALQAVWAAVDKLSRQQRIAFQLRFIEDMPLDAIAAAMNLDVGTVKTHLFRGLEAVRDACRGHFDSRWRK